MNKKCSHCKEIKLLEEFYKNLAEKDGCQNYCKECSKKYNQSEKIKEYMKAYRKSAKGMANRKNPKTIYYCLLANAKRDKRTVEFALYEFIHWYNKQNKICVYCHKNESDVINYKNGKYCRLSIDRMNNKIGYTLDNIALCCMSCNIRKSDDLTFDQMVKVAQFINKLKEQK